MLRMLSSRRMMSATSFATSVPRMPMAIPTSACFSAGASLTPSPVMATMQPPSCWYARTMVRLCVGETRAKTRVYFTQRPQKSSNLSASSVPDFIQESVKSSPGRTCSSSCSPVKTRYSSARLSLWSSCADSPDTSTVFGGLSGMMSIRLAIVKAVSGWSPVTMTVMQPASCNCAIDSFTPLLGGSSMAMQPQKCRSLKGKLASMGFEPLKSKPTCKSVNHRSASAKTRLPCSINPSNSRSNSCCCSPVRLHCFSTCSGAPLRTSRWVDFASSQCIVSMHFVELLKGIWNTSRCSVRNRTATSSPKAS
mmetsp:Transcript_86406/g.241727  ORF Transcript_86406/g.241727 Transcript_86406/m.241727 type:complete len:308 (+) Transcript_86406:754-1677(+)